MRTANTGVTGLDLGIFADSAGKPGEVLGRAATVSGQPGTSSWIKAGGLSVPVVGGTKYWLMLLPLGRTARSCFTTTSPRRSKRARGTSRAVASGLTALTAESSWETYNQGPVGFQALGTESDATPSVTIEGAPASMTAGTSVQLTAHVTNDSPTVTWTASAGSITSGGLYTAPSEPPAGGQAVVTATTSKGAHDQRSIEVVPAGARVLLAGDGTATYGVADQTGGGHEESFQFTAKASGTVQELQFRTNGTANTGVTGLDLGIFADSAGKPGEVLGRAATVSGQPGTSSWIKAGGLSVPVVGGTKYWLMLLPLGESSKLLHYNVAAALKAGTGNLESVASGLTALTAESSWETYNQGPVGFQALGTESDATPGGSRRSLESPASPVTASTASSPGRLPRARVMIEGAPASITAGTSVQLSALVANSDSGVAWRASAGSVSSSGLYVAPSRAPRGATVLLVASGAGARDERRLAITPVPSAHAAPAAPFSVPPGGSASLPALSTPSAAVIGEQLVMTTATGEAGRVRLSAYLGRERLGSCATQTPAQHVTCRLNLRGAPRRAAVSVWASLRVGGHVITRAQPAIELGQLTMAMNMPALPATSWLGNTSASEWALICAPSLRRAG